MSRMRSHSSTSHSAVAATFFGSIPTLLNATSSRPERLNGPVERLPHVLGARDVAADGERGPALLLADISEQGTSETARMLEELDLRSTAIGDRVLAHLARLPRLRVLDLSRTRVTDAGLAHLVGLPLEELHLDRCPITDAGMAHLCRLSSLTTLSLRDMDHVTGAGVDHLAALTRLRRLNIYSEEPTAEAEARLRTALPDLEIDA